MLKSKFLFVLVLAIFISDISKSQDIQNYKKSELSNKILNQKSISEQDENINSKVKIESAYKDEKKSPLLGALFSGILPGSGEFYAKSFVKAAIFFGIEAGLWTAYTVYESDGDQQTEDYQNFANQNWDVYKYAGWLKQEQFSGSDGIILTSNPNDLRKQVNIVEAQNFSHQLPPYGAQQYYELIGKYQNFVAGWQDADLNVMNRNNYITYKTTMFVNYSYDRQDANNYYNKSSTALSLIILNHVLSSADAAWSVSMFNKDLKVKTGVHFENKYSYNLQKKLIPVANLNVTF
ncbi:MAG TPA: hypothetical protein PKD83_13605 [Ignavibacteria bacterium]|nr:hypothetical protein [Ignavibacteria bacterium]